MILILKGYSQSRVITLDEFITSTCKNDSTFQYILMDKLFLEYREILSFQPSEVFLDVGGSYGVSFDFDHYPQLNVSITKLFAQSSSSIVLSGKSAYLGNSRQNSFGIDYNINFIKNAFGRLYKLQKEKAAFSRKIVEYQILQTYESYLYSLITNYYDWLETYSVMLAAHVSYLEGEKLLENIEKKKKYYIAYQIDVDKAKLQLLNKREKVRRLKESFSQFTIQIAYSIGDSLKADLIPDTINAYYDLANDIEEKIHNTPFDSTRSGKMFVALEQEDSLDFYLNMEDLLPSLTGFGSLIVGERDGEILSNSTISTGVKLSLPIKKEHQKANVEISKLNLRKNALEMSNEKSLLTLQLSKLQSAMRYEKESIEVSQERLELAEIIHQAELKDYQNGRSSLNDLIQALNTIQENRLSKITAKIELARKRLEVMELLDLLITEKDMINAN